MRGVLMTTFSGAIVQANEGAVALVGRAKSELVGRFFGDLFPSPYRVSMTSGHGRQHIAHTR